MWPSLQVTLCRICLRESRSYRVCLLATTNGVARSDYALWYIVLSAALLFHDSCVLIAASFAVLSLIVEVLQRQRAKSSGLYVIILALITAFAGQSLVAYGIKRSTRAAPRRLPFLSARLIEDGPGANFLRATCPQSGLAVCQYVGQLPISSQDFLFHGGPGKSVFEDASANVHLRAISAEQTRFLFAVFKFDPIGVLRSGIMKTVRGSCWSSDCWSLDTTHWRTFVIQTASHRTSKEFWTAGFRQKCSPSCTGARHTAEQCR